MKINQVKNIYFILSGLLFVISLFSHAVGNMIGLQLLLFGVLTLLNPSLSFFYFTNIIIIISVIKIKNNQHFKGFEYSYLASLIALLFYFVWPLLKHSQFEDIKIYYGYWLWLSSFFIIVIASIHLLILEKRNIQ